MLRMRFLALACFAVFSIGSARAEAVASQQAPAASEPLNASAAPAILNGGSIVHTASTEDDGKPHIATPATDAVSGAATAAPDASTAEKPVVAVAKPAPDPDPTLKASIDLAQQTMVVSEYGSVKYSWPISSGTAEFPTPRGSFRPQWVAKMWYSRKYDNAPMPNAVFINGGVAVHATQHVSRLGTAASHGCIRLAPTNAKTFYNLVAKHGMKATRVSIYGTPKWRSPDIASRNDDTRQRRYAQREESSSNFWFWEKPKFKPASAYDPGFTKRQYRQAPRGTAYANAQVPKGAYYLADDGRRIYVQQRQQRRAYYRNGYAYGGGGW